MFSFQGHSMTSSRQYPREWLDQIPAVVFACLRAGELRLLLCPGAGLADGGSPMDVSVNLVPIDLRMPNTRLWVQFDENWNVLRVWRREDVDNA
jgi:hypothetical protein